MICDAVGLSLPEAVRPGLHRKPLKEIKEKRAKESSQDSGLSRQTVQRGKVKGPALK